MAQHFTRSATLLFRFLLIGLPLAAVAIVSVTFAVYRSRPPGGKLPVAQPVLFDHSRHVGAGLDCRYCHSDVEVSPFAGIPSVSTCMGCHSQIWRNSELLLPVQQAAAGVSTLRWNRVNNLPDFVIFDHSIHVAKGVGCDTCHGRVDRMTLVEQVRPFHMAWCLDCHRNPERYVRPRDQVFNLAWEPPPDQEELGRNLVAEYGIRRKTDCSVCHY